MDTPTPVTPPSTAATVALLSQLASEKGLVEKIMADYHAGGIKALAGDVPQVIADGKVIFDDVRAAIPEVKAGYKTTEFWVTGAATAVVVGASVAGHPLPMGTDVIITTLVGVYTLGRAIVKAFGTQGPTAPAAAK